MITENCNPPSLPHQSQIQDAQPQTDSGVVHPQALFIASVLLSVYDDYLRVRNNLPKPIDVGEKVGYNRHKNKCSDETTVSDSLNQPEENDDERMG